MLSKLTVNEINKSSRQKAINNLIEKASESGFQALICKSNYYWSMYVRLENKEKSMAAEFPSISDALVYLKGFGDCKKAFVNEE